MTRLSGWLHHALPVTTASRAPNVGPMPQPSTSVFVIQYNSLLLAPRLLFGCVQIQQAGQEHLLLVLVDRIQERTLDRRFWLDHGAEIWPGRRWGLCGSNTQTLSAVLQCVMPAPVLHLSDQAAGGKGRDEGVAAKRLWRRRPGTEDRHQRERCLLSAVLGLPCSSSKQISPRTEAIKRGHVARTSSAGQPLRLGNTGHGPKQRPASDSAA